MFLLFICGTYSPRSSLAPQQPLRSWGTGGGGQQRGKEGVKTTRHSTHGRPPWGHSPAGWAHGATQLPWPWDGSMPSPRHQPPPRVSKERAPKGAPKEHPSPGTNLVPSAATPARCPRAQRPAPRGPRGASCWLSSIFCSLTPPCPPPMAVPVPVATRWPAGAGGLAALSAAAGAISIPETRPLPLNKKQTELKCRAPPAPGETRSSARPCHGAEGLRGKVGMRWAPSPSPAHPQNHP